MDENKRKHLQEIGFQLQPTCMLCKHATFPSNDWGTCNVHSYTHLKHVGEKRQLSIHKSGHCQKFELDSKVEATLEKFTEFLPNERDRED